MREFGVGVIGWGFMGKTHTYALRTLEQFYSPLPFGIKLRGVCSRRQEKAEEALSLGFAFAAADYRELLADPETDAVHICTPNAEHYPMFMDALAAGKAVCIDKPLADTGARAAEMAAAAAAFGIPCQMQMNNRFYPNVLYAREWIDAGNLGEVLSFRGVYLHSGSADPKKPMGWKQDAARAGGGVLLDLGTHLVDIARWLMGDFAEINYSQRVLYPARPDGQGTLRQVTAEDHAILLVRLPNGALGTLEASKIAVGHDDSLTLEIHGTKGAVQLSLADPNTVWIFNADRPEKESNGFTAVRTAGRFPPPGGGFPSYKNSIGWLQGHVHSIYSFYAAMAAGILPQPDAAEGAAVQAILQAAYDHREKGWVSL